MWQYAIPAAIQLASGLFGEDEDKSKQTSTSKTTYSQLPGYGESDAARGGMWGALQGGSAANMWGATEIDWDDIYDTALKQVNQFYGGSAMTTGLMDKVKASAARRGVSDSPALENTMAMTGIEQAGDISDLISNLTQQKSQYAESARGTWLNSIAALAGMKPQYGATGSTTTTTGQPGGGGGMADIVSGIGSGIGSIMSQKGQQDWYEKLLAQQMPSATQQSITGNGDWKSPTGQTFNYR